MTRERLFGPLPLGDDGFHAAAGRALEPFDHLVAAAAEQGARAHPDRDHGDEAAPGGDQHRRTDTGYQVHYIFTLIILRIHKKPSTQLMIPYAST